MSAQLYIYICADIFIDEEYVYCIDVIFLTVEDGKLKSILTCPICFLDLKIEFGT